MEYTYDDGSNELNTPKVSFRHLLERSSDGVGINEIHMSISVYFLHHMNILDVVRLVIVLSDRFRHDGWGLFSSHIMHRWSGA
jgi:hypothetical protein